MRIIQTPQPHHPQALREFCVQTLFDASIRFEHIQEKMRYFAVDLHTFLVGGERMDTGKLLSRAP